MGMNICFKYEVFSYMETKEMYVGAGYYKKNKNCTINKLKNVKNCVPSIHAEQMT